MPPLDLVRDELKELLPQSIVVRNDSIALLMPCYNEAISIAKMVRDFQRTLPSARIYVYGNNSTDDITIVAGRGAIVRYERPTICMPPSNPQIPRK